MAKLSPDAVEIYQDYMDVFRKASREITTSPWFADGWCLTKGIHARGIAMQLFKLGWHNQEGQGIHFETWIGPEERAAKQLPFVMHVEPDLPDRARFNAAFWACAGDTLAKWEGYQLKRENLMELWSKTLPLSKAGTAKSLVAEFTRAASLGECVDRALRSSR